MKMIKSVNKRILMIAAVTVMAILATAPGCGSKDSGKVKNESGFTDLNSFTAKTVDGNDFSEKDFSDYDVTVINVWSTTCGPCIREMPELAEYEKGLDDNVQFITYCLDAAYYPERTKKILEDSEYEGITLTGGDGDLETFTEELMYTPTTIFVDSKGNIIGDALIGAYPNVKEAYGARVTSALEDLGK